MVHGVLDCINSRYNTTDASCTLCRVSNSLRQFAGYPIHVAFPRLWVTQAQKLSACIK
jgi:hypothetical protein